MDSMKSFCSKAYDTVIPDMNSIKGYYRQAGNSILPEFAKPKLGFSTKAEIAQSGGKIALLDFCQKATTVASMAIAPIAIAGPLVNHLGPIKLSDWLHDPREYFGGTVEGFIYSAAILIPSTILSGCGIGALLGHETVNKVLYGAVVIFTVVMAVGVFAPLVNPIAALVVTATLFVASRILKHMKQNEMESLAMRNGGQIPRALQLALPCAESYARLLVEKQV